MNQCDSLPWQFKLGMCRNQALDNRSSSGKIMIMRGPKVTQG